MEIDKENVVQAVVIMDTFNNNFNPVSKSKPMGLFPVAGVPLLDYMLEALALGGVGETILFCCQFGTKIKDHVRTGIENKSTWSLSMDVQVLMSDTCQTMGDAMREIDATGLVRGYFILTGVNTVTNINFSSLLEQHKQTCKKDKGAVMTLVYKKVSWEHPLINADKPIFLAVDANTKRVLIHEKFKPKSNHKTINLPLESILSHSEVQLQHNLADGNIALCSPTVPPLFSENFDFQTKDDFINGTLVTNEEIQTGSLYYTLLNDNQYAAAITNWKIYQTVSHDVLHYWAHPLSIESGSFYQDNYVFMGYHNFRKKTSTLNRSCSLLEDVLVGDNTHMNDYTLVSKSMIGNDCMIGNNVTITGSHIMNNVVIKDNCKITNSFIDDHCVIEENSIIEGGTIIASNVHVKARSQLNGNIIETSEDKDEKTLVKSTSESGTEWENESSGSGGDEFIGFERNWTDSETCYSSDSSAESSLPDSPVPEDTNIFLQEVIDSLARGYEEKLKCDYLILEINSSRYAYNIQLHEVNFFVVRALLSIPVLTENKNVLSTIKDILKFFRPVLSNYIKTKSSIMDCLRAVEDSCTKCEWLDGKAGQVLHLLYEADVVDEDSLVEWYKDLKDNASAIVEQTSIVKFFEWLQEASEESEESD